MPIRIAIALLAVALAGCLYAGYARDDVAWALGAVPAAVGLAVLIALRPQLDWAYYRKHTPDLPPPVRDLFDAKLGPYYVALPDDQRLRFRRHTFLTRLALDYRAMGFEADELPPDIGYLIASQLARLTFATAPARYVYEPFENVVLYRHPFPTPAHPREWHSSELFAEDGVVIFNLGHVVAGIVEPRRHFNIVLYEWIRVRRLVAPEAEAGPPHGLSGPAPWTEVVDRCTPHDPEWVHSAVGLREIDGPAALRVVAYEFPDAFAEHYPALHAALRAPAPHAATPHV